ncbi:lysylphosphatidylglycerol synthase transmembrane domain-containing protein [Tengunoibacter tsumagoiensis]|uniref:TIGR00374 family protein n=1 Tax=Tengunoibacter tsumagoiensis TaxID=2014871 RepID=A0A401ZY68_9CHLR|nr:lysylphosphatidylglycerol synthase transmembrane domain-containing protein [Tengunoibacter tsumagoiensis]GCE11791.1 TIGR00374 family protein [Tengunoibacter tsumagoiensis]
MLHNNDEVQFEKPITIEGRSKRQKKRSLPPASPSDDARGAAASMPEISPEQLSLRKKLLNWRTLLPLVIVVIALVFLARKTDINPQKTLAALSSANIAFFCAAFVIYYLSFGLRAIRWRLLLENVGFTPANGINLPRVPKLVEMIYISFFANTVVPAKLGDLYRAYLLRQEIKVSTTRSFGTVLAERLLDLIVLLLLFIPALLVSLRQNLPSQLRIGLEILLGAVVAGIGGLFLLRLGREYIAQFLPQRFREQYYHFQEGTLGSFRRIPLLSLLTLGVWGCEALRFFFIALALHLLPGDLLHILSASIFIGLGEALLTAIPATGGGLGLVEGGMVAMLALFTQGSDAVNRAAAAILLDRVITFFSILVFGFIVFLLAFGKKARRRAS